MGPTPPHASSDPQTPDLPFGTQTHPLTDSSSAPLPFSFPGAAASTSDIPAPSTSSSSASSNPFNTLVESLTENPSALVHQLEELGQDVAKSTATHTVVEPTYIEGHENFESAPSYNALASRVSDMHPESISTLAATCREVAKVGVEADFQDLTKLVGRQWTGIAASAAADAVSAMSGCTTELTAGIADVGTRLESVSTTADLIRLKVPVRQFGTPISLLTTATGAAARAAAEAEEENARREAILALETIYAPSYTNAGTGVPVLPAPDLVQGSSGSTGSYAPTGSPGIQTGPGPDNGGGAPSADEGAPTGPPGARDPATTDPTGQQATGEPGAPEGPASTNAAATMNPNAGGPQGHVGSGSVRDGLTSTSTGTGGASGQGVGAAAYARGTGVGGGTSGAGSRSGGGHNEDTDQTNGVGMVPGAAPGAAALGAGAGAGAGAAIGAASQTSLARPGMGVGGSMMAPPRGANADGDDDKEHETPTYLITVDNGNDLVGPIEPVAPPVIGA